jgi:hypothetical protein
MTKPHEPLDIQQRGLPVIRTQKVRGDMDHEMINPALRVWLEEKAAKDGPDPALAFQAAPLSGVASLRASIRGRA